jgi:hypothetical protein
MENNQYYSVMFASVDVLFLYLHYIPYISILLTFRSVWSIVRMTAPSTCNLDAQNRTEILMNFVTKLYCIMTVEVM